MNFFNHGRCEARRKCKNSTLTIFKDRNSKLVLTDKCQFYIEGIALSTSNKELHEIDNTPSNKCPSEILLSC